MKFMSRNRLLLLGGAVTILVADQLSKSWVVQNLPLYVSTDLFPWLKPVMSLTHVTNTGVAFGLFPQLGNFFTILSMSVIVLIILFQNSLAEAYFWVHLALGMVAGGALGNVTDRIFRGAVVDFFDVNFWPFHEWPVFNVADSAVVVGVIILLLDSMFFDPTREKQPLEQQFESEDGRVNA